MKRHYLLDTSYLTELYLIPGKSNSHPHAEITSRFRQANKSSASFYVTTGVIYEVGNHIAQVMDGKARKTHAEKLAVDVLTAIQSPAEAPWLVLPAESHERLRDSLHLFAKTYASQGVGLTDSQIIQEARILKRCRDHDFVHIWTRDQKLKAEEPDPEPNPFV